MIRRDVDDDAESDEPTPPEPRGQARRGHRRFGQAVVDRLPQLGVAIVAGLLLCLSFPPFGWWYLAFIAFALLAWVLTRESTTLAGGFGYGFLFGLAFYLPLLPWISGLVGALPWIALSAMEALFPGVVRRCRRSPCGGCPAGRCGSRGCGRPRNGSSRPCRSADSLGG